MTLCVLCIEQYNTVSYIHGVLWHCVQCARSVVTLCTSACSVKTLYTLFMECYGTVYTVHYTVYIVTVVL
jgi:hypothetical protein